MNIEEIEQMEEHKVVNKTDWRSITFKDSDYFKPQGAKGEEQIVIVSDELEQKNVVSNGKTYTYVELKIIHNGVPKTWSIPMSESSGSWLGRIIEHAKKYDTLKGLKLLISWEDTNKYRVSMLELVEV